MSSDKIRFYRRAAGHDGRGEATEAAGYSWHFWRPSLLRPLPPGSWAPKFWAWFMLDRLKVFRSAGYGVLVAYRHGVVFHRSCVFPRFFRFPFMGAEDLQVGDVWTHELERGKGLATTALRRICSMLGGTGSLLWYLVEDQNSSSIRVAEKMGFELIGLGRKYPRFGIRFLGCYEIEEHLGPQKGVERLV